MGTFSKEHDCRAHVTLTLPGIPLKRFHVFYDEDFTHPMKRWFDFHRPSTVWMDDLGWKVK